MVHRAVSIYFRDSNSAFFPSLSLYKNRKKRREKNLSFRKQDKQYPIQQLTVQCLEDNSLQRFGQEDNCVPYQD